MSDSDLPADREHDAAHPGAPNEGDREHLPSDPGEGATSDPVTGPIPTIGSEPAGEAAPWRARPSGALAAPHGLGDATPQSTPTPSSFSGPATSPWQRPSAAQPTDTSSPLPTDPSSPPPPGTGGWTSASSGATGAGQTGAQPAGTGPAWSSPWSAAGAPTGTSFRPAQPWSPMYTGAGQASPPGGAVDQQASSPPGRRRLATALVIVAVLVLALAAGFGGGWWGSSVATRSAAGSSDASLTQQTQGQPASEATGSAGSVQAVADAVLPSVVSVVAVSQNGGDEGSGVILTDSGLILTNNHVIDGAQRLTVQLNDGTTATATVVGTDATDDLAVIKVSGISGLKPATLGTSANLKVGQQVVAVGSPLGLSATVTTGIVSALNRPVRTSSDTGQSASGQDTVLNAIQTDAAINPGNSGGPLLDMNGYVIGINSAIATLSSGSSGQSGSIGVGFAIPIDQAHRIAQEIINTGKASHAVLGATVYDAVNSQDGITTGAAVKSVTPDGGADKAGIKAGDVITKVDDTAVESADALVATIRSSDPGGKIQVTYVRDGKSSTVTVTLGSATD